jgi:hypothetical protein
LIAGRVLFEGHRLACFKGGRAPVEFSVRVAIAE